MSAVNTVEKAADLLAKINPEVAALSERIVAGVKADGKIEGGDHVASAALYASLLPEGLTIEQAEGFAKFHSVLYPAMGKAAGELGVPAFVADKELQKINLQLPTIGKDVIRANFERERTFPDQQTKGTITKMGQVQIDHQIYGTKNRGEVTKVKSYLSALALEALAGK
jgi:hypothetical protein